MVIAKRHNPFRDQLRDVVHLIGHHHALQRGHVFHDLGRRALITRRFAEPLGRIEEPPANQSGQIRIHSGLKRKTGQGKHMRKTRILELLAPSIGEVDLPGR